MKCVHFPLHIGRDHSEKQHLVSLHATRLCSLAPAIQPPCFRRADEIVPITSLNHPRPCMRSSANDSYTRGTHRQFAICRAITSDITVFNYVHDRRVRTLCTTTVRWNIILLPVWFKCLSARLLVTLYDDHFNPATMEI